MTNISSTHIIDKDRILDEIKTNDGKNQINNSKKKRTLRRLKVND